MEDLLCFAPPEKHDIIAGSLTNLKRVKFKFDRNGSQKYIINQLIINKINIMSTKIKFTIKNYFNSHALLFEKMDITKINTALELLKSKYLAGNKIITWKWWECLPASHYITDWIKW